MLVLMLMLMLMLMLVLVSVLVLMINLLCVKRCWGPIKRWQYLAPQANQPDVQLVQWVQCAIHNTCNTHLTLQYITIAIQFSCYVHIKWSTNCHAFLARSALEVICKHSVSLCFTICQDIIIHCNAMLNSSNMFELYKLLFSGFILLALILGDSDSCK